MNTHTHKDLFGKDINVGDYIVYSAVDGRSGTLRVGKVEALKVRESGFSDDKPQPTVFCRSWSNFNTYEKDENGRQTGRQKNVTLGFLDRLIVIDPSQISEKIKLDLEGGIGKWR